MTLHRREQKPFKCLWGLRAQIQKLRQCPGNSPQLSALSRCQLHVCKPKMGGIELPVGSGYRPVVFKISSRDPATPESLMTLVRNWRHLPCQANLTGRYAGSETETGTDQASQQMLPSSSSSPSLLSLLSLFSLHHTPSFCSCDWTLGLGMMARILLISYPFPLTSYFVIVSH